MPSFKVLLFDLDDTLIYFDDYWKESLIETFRQHDSTREYDEDELFNILWKHNKTYEQQYHKQEITLQQFRNYRLIYTLLDLGKGIDERIANDFNHLHKTLSRNFMKANPDLVDLLIELKKSYSIGIVTNGTIAWQYDKIDAMGIKFLFEDGSIIVSEEVGCEKPDPQIYHKALDYFGVTPKETIFIGDSWANDVEGPAKIGISSIWINNRQESERVNLKLIGTVSNLFEIKHLL
jgi:HAD superfamily hydrolase (TIGR01549 family)